MIVYKTTNTVNGKIYIGQDSKNRSAYLGSGKYFKRARAKYGRHSFKKEVLKECLTAHELNLAEIEAIAHFKSTDPSIGYNICPGGRTTLGLKLTPAQIEANRLRNTGARNPRHGVRHTDSALSVMRACKAKERNPNFGKVTPESVRRKIRASSPLSLPVIEVDSSGATINSWLSASEAAQSVGCNVSSIACVCRGVYKTAHRRLFRYVNREDASANLAL